MPKAKQRYETGKEPKKKKAISSIEIQFRDGPRDGKTMIVCNPPPPRMRLAFPEWCNYYRIGDSFVFQYDMETPWKTVNALSLLPEDQ